MSTITSWMLASCSLGLTKSVAPNCAARWNFSGLTSMAMMRLALAICAPWITARPMAPRPKTATVAPGSTLAVFITAPMPVVTPQPSRQILSSGASLETTASDTSGSTVYSLKVEQPM